MIQGKNLKAPPQEQMTNRESELEFYSNEAKRPTNPCHFVYQEEGHGKWPETIVKSVTILSKRMVKHIFEG